MGGNNISASGISQKWVKSKRCRWKKKEEKVTDGFGLWFVVLWCGFVVCGFLRKIRPTKLWVELSWVVAIYISYLNLKPWTDRLKKNIFKTSENIFECMMHIANDGCYYFLNRKLRLKTQIWDKKTNMKMNYTMYFTMD